MSNPAEDVRGPIEQEHNKTRDDREKQYVDDRVALETDFHSDLIDIQAAKEAALVDAGLNPDGGVPTDYSGPPVTPLTNPTSPVISGTQIVGNVLTASGETWTGNPTEFVYSWQRSLDDGVTWSSIPGATSANYTLVTADGDNKVRVIITAFKTGTPSVESVSLAKAIAAA